jgi:hypothetical protein
LAGWPEAGVVVSVQMAAEQAAVEERRQRRREHLNARDRLDGVGGRR